MKKFVAIFLFVTILWISPLSATRRYVSFSFNNADILDVVKAVSKLTGKSFVVSDRLRGKVTIIGSEKMSIRDAYRVFLTVLKMKGFTVVRAGRVYKIIQVGRIAEEPLRVYVGKGYMPDADEFFIKIIPLEYVSADEIQSVVKNFMSRDGKLIAYSPTNVLIIRDTGKVINTILNILGVLDTSGGEVKMEIIPLKYIPSDDMVKIINEIFSLKSAARRRGFRERSVVVKGGFKVISESRTNSIIVLGTDADIKKVKNLVRKFDKEVGSATSQVHVIFLRYADATELASTLGQLAAGLRKIRPGEKRRTPVAQFENGAIRITADKATNSLIVIASPADYALVKNLVSKLDIPRRQVYVEAAILEISLDKLRDLGVSLHGGKLLNEGEAVVLGGEALGGINTLGLNPTALSGLGGLFFGFLGKMLDLGGNVQVPSVAALLRAIETSNAVNIISTPHLLTSDNEEAEIIVGENVPFITGQNVTSGGNILTTIERKDVGVTLRITPQINESDHVKLKIYQEISQVSPQQPQGVNVNQQGLVTRKRSAKTTVVVKDRQTVVIGGLISSQESFSDTKVPILGDIPVIGWFFKSRKKTITKTDLLIFITPYIVKNDQDLVFLNNLRSEQLDQFKEEVGAVSLGKSMVIKSSFPPPPTKETEAPREITISPYSKPATTSTYSSPVTGK